MFYVRKISIQRCLLNVLLSTMIMPIKSMEMTKDIQQLKREVNEAIYNNDVKRITLLLNSAAIDVKNYALKIASILQKRDIISAVLALGANIHEQIDRQTAIHWAAMLGGHRDTIRLLLANGANIDERDVRGKTALHLVASTGQTHLIDVLLECGANINGKDNNGRTPLHWAIQEGHEQFVERLLINDANVNEKDNNGTTILHWAVRKGHEQIIERLLNLGANINEKDVNGNTALHQVVKDKEVIEREPQIIETGLPFVPKFKEKEHKKIVELLLNRGSNINETNYSGETALHWVVQTGRQQIIELLLKRGANIDGKDCDGNTALHWAVRKGHQQIIKLLLKSGASIKIKNYDGDSVLHIASCYGYRELVKLLLDSHATINEKNNEGKTALHFAAANGHRDVIKVLLASHAKINDKDTTGETALHLAAGAGQTETVETLLTFGAEVNVKDLEERTALHHAAIYGNYKEVVEVLIIQGANIHEKDITGRTALNWALEKGHKGIVQFLQSYPVNIFEKLMKILQKNEQLAYLPALEKHLQSKTFCNKINTVLSGRQCLLPHLEETKIAVNPNHSPLSITAERFITHLVEKNYKEGPETDHSLENNHYDIRFKENYQETFNAGLALDGEGLQVMVTASMIEELEKEGYIIHKLFDIITGSSFAGILALGLTASKDGYERSIETKDIIKLFSEDFRDIFSVKNKIKIKPYYALKPLQKALANLFKETVLSNALSRVMVPCQAKKPFDFDSLEAQKRASRDFYLRDTAYITAVDANQEYFPAMPLGLDGITASSEYKNKSAEFLIRNAEATLNKEEMQKFRLLYCVAHQDEGNMRLNKKLEKMNELTAQEIQKSSEINNQIAILRKEFDSLSLKKQEERHKNIDRLERERSQLATPRYCYIKPTRSEASSFDNINLLDTYKEQGKKAAEDFIKNNEQLLHLLKENSDRKKHLNFFAS